MRTIEANFTSRTEDHCIALASPVARLHQLCIRAGDRVRITDGEMEVEADIEFRGEDAVARPKWNTLTYRD